MKRLITKIMILLAALAIIAGTTSWFKTRPATTLTTFRTARIERGDLTTTIEATGTVEPEEVIDVGAQVAGKIVSFGQDITSHTIDYSSIVEQGAVMARIDDSIYTAELTQAEAQVRSAKASVRRSEADLEQLKAKLAQAEHEWVSGQQLKIKGVISDSNFDEYKTNFDCTRANVTVGEAAIEQARADLVQAEASASRARQNLAYCVIMSPVRGVIIDRRVNIGQTVVASMSAPSLFLLAKDLTRMQVWVAVNEADVGSIKARQKVRFTVDAFPDESFEGKVRKVRLNASMTQNVVTYTVEIQVDNTNGRLLPYLTANVQFETNHHENVLLVPNAALKWTPPESVLSGNAPAENSGQSKAPATANQGANGVIYVADGKQSVRPLSVNVGLSNGLRTEISGEGISEGLDVVTGTEMVAADSTMEMASKSGEINSQKTTKESNPFVPNLPKPPKGAGPPM